MPRPGGIVPTDRSGRVGETERQQRSYSPPKAAKVPCADVNQNAANETVEIIRQENGTAKAIRADVTSHDEIRRMVKACTDL